MTLEEMRAALAAKAKRLKELVGKDGISDEERAEKRSLLDECQSLKDSIAEVEAEQRMLEDLDESYVTPPPGKKPGKSEREARHEVIHEPPVYRSFGEQLQDIISLTHQGRSDRKIEARERLAKAEKRMIEDRTMDLALRKHLQEESRAALSGQEVGVAEYGGGFVQTDFATDIIDKGFNNSIVIPKTQRRRLSGNSNSIEIYGIDEDSRVAGSRYGGVVVYTKKENQQYTASRAKFKGIEVKVNKLTGLLGLSDEIMEDAAFLEDEVSSLFGMEFAFRTQELLFTGTGAGEPLGIKNAPCLVTVAKETGQLADSIVVENIDKMVARVAGGAAEFYANRDIVPQLKQLYRTVDANNVQAVFKQTSINSGLLDGIPIYFVEQCSTLGDLGDLYLADWSAYITATKGGMKKAESMHLYFDYGQKALRWTLRFDGQPRWSSALTPANGSNTISPFVTLAARA